MSVFTAKNVFLEILQLQVLLVRAIFRLMSHIPGTVVVGVVQGLHFYFLLFNMWRYLERLGYSQNFSFLGADRVVQI